MAKIRGARNAYLIREDGTFGPWKLALKMTSETAIARSAELRSRGIQAEAIADSGGDSLEPHVEAAPVRHASVTWRGITPTEAPGGKWIHIFKDPDSQSNQLITGDSPIDVITKIQDLAGWNRETQSLNRYAGHPAFSRYVQSLPLDPGMTSEPGAPAFTQPPPRPATPGSVLRPGSNAHSIEDLPQRSAQPQRIVREDFAAWERTATAKAYQERCKTDPAFLAWADSQAATR